MTKAQARLQELGSGRIGPLLLKLSLPALVSMTLNSLYQVVDRFFIGFGCGDEAMAGVSLTIPLLMGLGAFGVWIGAGHGSLLAIKLGEGDRVTAEKVLGEVVLMKVVAFIVLPALIYLFVGPIVDLCGGDGVTAGAKDLAIGYLRIVLPLQVCTHLAFGLSGQMRSEGAAAQSMTCMVIGFATNLALDPFFIFDSIPLGFIGLDFTLPGLGLGVNGAAWATNAAMAASCLFALAYYLGGHSAVRMRIARMRFYAPLAKRALGIGAAPFLQQLMGAAIGLSLTKALTLWAENDADATLQVEAFGIFHATVLLFLMPTLGIQQGVGPIMGYNWGARNYIRVREALKLGFWLTTVIVSVAALVQVVCPEAIASCFGAKGRALAVSARVLRISNCMLWCIGLNVIATTYFQSIGKPWTAIILSGLRQGGCLLPCIWIFPYFFADPVFGIWLSMPVSDVVCQIATIPPMLAHLRFLRGAGMIVSRSRSSRG